MPRSSAEFNPLEFQDWKYEHKDLVLSIDWNYYGTRVATASSDHTVKVWEKKDDGNMGLLDSWRAHDGEVLKVRWSNPHLTAILGTISTDGTFHLFCEDVLALPQSGHRFPRIYSLRSPAASPLVGLDFRWDLSETCVALITRDGYLQVLEATTEDCNEWREIYAAWQPNSGGSTDSGFDVSFHKEGSPCWAAVQVGLDRKSIGMAVAAMDKILVYRTDRERKFYISAELSGARDIIREVAWAGMACRGHDLIAGASKDGFVRIWEVHSDMDRNGERMGAREMGGEFHQPGEKMGLGMPRTENDSGVSPRTRRSGITSGLKEPHMVTRAPIDRRIGDSPRDISLEEDRAIGRIKQRAILAGELAHKGAAWRCLWSFFGDALITAGDDGVIRVWKKGLAGQWLEAAEVEAEF
ncbi:WD40 repeat-like protein [Eremomyces bilateralis CBS 781.70]|uniref:WD40 repeat-like protein n=1 Tax=Eremomyces bilateralis CBS 781.70 TaxID=1392243 RepID=A0A6G1G4V5_9PEZI|nr:WD40 repeat-like protein [Eremomyces bilateralis CBS 781.70]KAF1813125.1 WD40 repeat-like protein [Eremomyces bilateralis CBS 781.70]